MPMLLNFAVLSQLPVNTRAPSLLHAQHITGASCEMAAFGTALPSGCTSQQRICECEEGFFEHEINQGARERNKSRT